MKKEQEDLSEMYYSDVQKEMTHPAKLSERTGIYFTTSARLPRWWRAISSQEQGLIVITSQSNPKEERERFLIDPKKASDFIKYSKQWKQETAGLSSPSSIRMNRNYQKIIGIGEQVIPLILRELEREADDWFYALEMLVDDNENPITEEMGFNESVQAWIKWGKDRKVI